MSPLYKHPRLADREDTSLMIVDVQPALMQVIWERERLLENLVRLLKSAQVLHLPVIATVQNPQKLGDLLPEVSEHLPPSLTPIPKMAFSCLSVPEVRNALADTHRRTVILCGVETHICINQTAHHLLALGYHVHIPADAVSSRREFQWRIGLEKMANSGAVITSTETVLCELLGEAGTPEFRALLPLFKENLTLHPSNP